MNTDLELNGYQAEQQIAYILSRVEPPLSRLDAACLMLFRINGDDGRFISASDGPNVRYTDQEVGEIIKGLRMRAMLPAEANES